FSQLHTCASHGARRRGALTEISRAFPELGWHPACSDCSVLMSGEAGAPVPIGVVMTSFEPGGTERQMIELVRRLDGCRWTVHVACFHARGGWFGRVAEAAASVAEFPVTSFRDADAARHLWSFAQWCRTHRLAIVHTTELYSN